MDKTFENVKQIASQTMTISEFVETFFRVKHPDGSIRPLEPRDIHKLADYDEWIFYGKARRPGTIIVKKDK